MYRNVAVSLLYRNVYRSNVSDTQKVKEAGCVCEYALSMRMAQHECLKSSLAFRKPAVAAASCRPARADGP